VDFARQWGSGTDDGTSFYPDTFGAIFDEAEKEFPEIGFHFTNTEAIGRSNLPATGQVRMFDNQYAMRKHGIWTRRFDGPNGKWEEVPGRDLQQYYDREYKRIQEDAGSKPES
jgi:hypothetical protein